jgi:hypothetical protein
MDSDRDRCMLAIRTRKHGSGHTCIQVSGKNAKETRRMTITAVLSYNNTQLL